MPPFTIVDPPLAESADPRLQRTRLPGETELRGDAMLIRDGALPQLLAKFLQATRVFALWRERIRRRRELRHLCALDDHILGDIGLARMQLFFEASKRFWR
jgi:uncharacterized protein YjiS (DUF1127 family)